MHQKLIIVAMFGAITLPAAAFAETDSLGEIVVTATRMPQSLSKTIADVTVLNEQEIKKSAAPDVPTLLRSLAGVEVGQSGGLGAFSSIRMRGTNPNQVLVLLDGVRINSATSGTTALEHIMLDSIERIEVVRGNVSSLYGSEAIGGVIQLFTKQGRGAPAINVSAGAGSYGTQRLSAGIAGELNDTSFNLNAGHVKTDGVSAMNPLLAPGANPNKNGYSNDSFNAQIKHAINANHMLSASAFSSRGDSSMDATGFGTKPTDLNNSIANISKFSLASDDQFSDGWHSQLRLAQGVDESQTFGGNPGRFQTRSNQVAWQNNLKIALGQQLSFSVENLDQAVASSTLFSKTSRKVNSLLGGYVGEYGLQQVQLNLRQDHYSDFGTANTGLLGYGLSFSDSWRATASISNAFKAPTLNDMFYPFTNFGFGFTYAGNPNLKPERSQSREAGLHYAGDGPRIDVVYFDNRISDLIGSNAAGSTMININQAQIIGQELSYSGDFGNKHLKASATFQNPRDVATGALLQRRAKQFGSIAASHDFNDWNMGAELRYSGARQDFNYNLFPSVAVSLPSYQLFNLTTRYQINKNLSLSGRMDNVFNRSYSEVYSYNTLGRTLFVGLTYQQ
ncbi:MAG: TonB-dependent receptor [Nitrosomonadales bacterium]